MRVLVTGGAGFVGSAIARHFRRQSPTHSVVVFDNLRRRGSESNLPGLAGEGVQFVHGDVRNPPDLDALEGNFDVLIEASAEPSVHAGTGGSPRYVLDTNLVGAMNCLEFARERCGSLIFLSSSRVFSIDPLRQLPLRPAPLHETATRLDLHLDLTQSPIAGLSAAGIDENFACNTHRSYYGASKLAAELFCQEYAAHSRLPIVINRCGVIAGPGQFGRTDQGVFTLWVAHHLYGRPLKYTGFGGTGLQVRDLLHPADLCELLSLQLANLAMVSGETFNVGGGRAGSVSLQEFTQVCQSATGCSVPITSNPATLDVDIPWFITDHSKISALLGWQPVRKPQEIVHDITHWIRSNENTLRHIIA